MNNTKLLCLGVLIGCTTIYGASKLPLYDSPFDRGASYLWPRMTPSLQRITGTITQLEPEDPTSPDSRYKISFIQEGKTILRLVNMEYIGETILGDAFRYLTGDVLEIVNPLKTRETIIEGSSYAIIKVSTPSRPDKILIFIEDKEHNLYKNAEGHICFRFPAGLSLETKIPGCTQVIDLSQCSDVGYSFNPVRSGSLSSFEILTEDHRVMHIQIEDFSKYK